jgi:hypothetical protein
MLCRRSNTSHRRVRRVFSRRGTEYFSSHCWRFQPPARRQIFASGSCAALLHGTAQNTSHLMAPRSKYLPLTRAPPRRSFAARHQILLLPGAPSAPSNTCLWFLRRPATPRSTEYFASHGADMIPERRQILHTHVCAALLRSWRRILLLPGAPSARREILALGSCAVLLHHAAQNTLHLMALT